jgi:hypothetical protein
MAFETVDVSSLKNSINSCKNSINHKTTDSLIESVSNNAVWQTDAKNNLKKSLERLNNERYNPLEQKLESYLAIASMIEEYQSLVKENDSLEKQYSSLQSRLYYTEYYTTTSTDSEGNTHQESHSRTVKDYGVERQMIDVRRQINENKSRMEILQNNVSNLI